MHTDPRTELFQPPTDERAMSANQFFPASSNFAEDLVFSLSFQAQPRLSGFLRMKKSRFRGWKDRWFVLIPGPSYVAVQYYRRRNDLSSNSFKRDCIASEGYAFPEPKLGQNCFSFVSTNGNRVYLAATSEFQRNLWISCINSMLDERADLPG